jgi:hypothetical protein
MVELSDETPRSGEPAAPHDAGTLIGKRYATGEPAVEVLCTKPGTGSLSIGEDVLPGQGGSPAALFGLAGPTLAWVVSRPGEPGVRPGTSLTRGLCGTNESPGSAGDQNHSHPSRWSLSGAMVV